MRKNLVNSPTVLFQNPERPERAAGKLPMLSSLQNMFWWGGDKVEVGTQGTRHAYLFPKKTRSHQQSKKNHPLLHISDHLGFNPHPAFWCTWRFRLGSARLKIRNNSGGELAWYFRLMIGWLVHKLLGLTEEDWLIGSRSRSWIIRISPTK